MKEKLKSLRRPSPAIIIAIIALVAALGGTAVAGGVLTTKKFKNKAVRGPLTYVTASQAVNSSAPTYTQITALCPAGTHVIGGSVKLENADQDYTGDDYPTTTGWTARVYTGGPAGTIRTQTVYAICATVKNISGGLPSS